MRNLPLSSRSIGLGYMVWVAEKLVVERREGKKSLAPSKS